MSSPKRHNENPLSPSPEISGPAMEGHKYDGIREYDNPMPGWWVWLFIGTIVFSPIYILGVHKLGLINTYEDDLAEAQAELNRVREVYASTGPSFKTDAGALREYAADPLLVASGAATYATVCAACHGDAGQGLIGPNLTDEFWITGGSEADIYQNIAEGVPASGMPAWGATLSPEEMAGAMAFVISLSGTNPPNPKPPQGEPYLGR